MGLSLVWVRFGFGFGSFGLGSFAKRVESLESVRVKCVEGLEMVQRLPRVGGNV